MHPGSRIRKIRRRQGRTLEEIARRSGFTRSLLSKIENEKTTPPVSTLMKIADALGVNFSALLDEQKNTATVYTSAKDARARKIETDKGYDFFTFASDRPDKSMQPFLFVAEKGKVVPHTLSHRGEEFIYVVSGRVRYRVGNVTYTLGTGDSLYFDSEEDHELIPETKKAVCLAVFTEPKESEKKKGKK